MEKVLIAYTTNAGSTGEIADIIAEELRRCGDQVDVMRLEEVVSISGYGTVIVGAPMILGWHRAAVKFVKKHRDALAQTRVAYFCSLMSLTHTEPPWEGPFPMAIDPWLAQPPKNPARLGIKERYATLSNYLKPIIRAAPEVRPVSVAMLGGKMELFRLPWWQMLFVMVIIQAKPGDRRNRAFIRLWAEQVMQPRR
jgi:menaquinone-dependent protoporphyrinogen IX oxidase